MTKKMAGNLQPLVNNQRIVKDDGTPTDYFIRWAQQKQIDIGSGITAEQAVQIITQYLADHELQAGSGIQITPSGNISDSPTIAAEVQAILDQITNVRGSVLFRGAAGWQALGPGTNGYFLRTNGAGADPSWAAGGGGGGGGLPFAPPTAADFTTTGGNAGSITCADTAIGMIVTQTNSTTSGRWSYFRGKALPAGDFQLIVGMNPLQTVYDQWYWQGIAACNVANADTWWNSYYMDAGASQPRLVSYWNTAWDQQEQSAGRVTILPGSSYVDNISFQVMIKMTLVGSTLTLSFSYDSVHWIDLWSYPTSSMFTAGMPTHIGFHGGGTATSGTGLLNVFYWDQSW